MQKKSSNNPEKAERKRDGSGGKASKKGQQAAKSAAELRQEELDKMIDGMVSLGQGVLSDVWQISSHAGWLARVITGLADTFSTPPTTAACYLAAGLLVLLLVSPASWIPQIAAPVVLLVPLQNTFVSISLETKKTRSAAVDSAQWAVFWLVWCILGRIGSWVAVFRPGWDSPVGGDKGGSAGHRRWTMVWARRPRACYGWVAGCADASSGRTLQVLS